MDLAMLQSNPVVRQTIAESPALAGLMARGDLQEMLKAAQQPMQLQSMLSKQQPLNTTLLYIDRDWMALLPLL